MAKPIKKRKNIVSDILNSNVETKKDTSLDLSNNVNFNEASDDCVTTNYDIVSENEIVVENIPSQLIELQNQIDESNARYLDLAKDFDIKVEENNRIKEENDRLMQLVNDLNFEIKKLTDVAFRKDIEISDLELKNASLETRNVSNNQINTKNINDSKYNINTHKINKKYVDQAALEGYESWN